MSLHVAPDASDAKAEPAVPDGLLRHIRACRGAVPPRGRLPFRLGAAVVGWITPGFAAVLAGVPGMAAAPDGVRLDAPERLEAIAADLAAAGHLRWRGEAFDVRVEPDGPVLARIDRGALLVFGIGAVGVHVNGLVETAAGSMLWVARRAANKSLDPGKLDHIVAGGVPAGLTPAETLVKEAAEEAAIPAALAGMAVPVGRFDYAMERPEGLRRDRILAYDLALPEGFVPRAADGEVAGFELWPLARALAAVRATEDFKFNVNLVLIDLFLRRGMVPAAEAGALRAALG